MAIRGARTAFRRLPRVRLASARARLASPRPASRSRATRAGGGRRQAWSGTASRAWGGRRSAVASRRGRLASLGVSALLLVGAVTGCGSSNFPNDPRPPTPIEVSAKVDSERVQVAPDRFGAGLVNFTIANLSSAPVTFDVTGPTKGSSTEIQPGAPDSLRMSMKEGTYRVTASKPKIKPATIKVGPERKSSQNKLLEP